MSPRLKLKQKLLELGIPQNEFKRLLKMSDGNFRKYISAKANPTLKTMGKFAKALGIKICDLIKE